MANQKFYIPKPSKYNPESKSLSIIELEKVGKDRGTISCDNCGRLTGLNGVSLRKINENTYKCQYCS